MQVTKGTPRTEKRRLRSRGKREAVPAFFFLLTLVC